MNPLKKMVDKAKGDVGDMLLELVNILKQQEEIQKQILSVLGKIETNQKIKLYDDKTIEVPT